MGSVIEMMGVIAPIARVSCVTGSVAIISSRTNPGIMPWIMGCAGRRQLWSSRVLPARTMRSVGLAPVAIEGLWRHHHASKSRQPDKVLELPENSPECPIGR